MTNIEFDSANNTAVLQSMDEDVKNMIIDQVEQDLDRVLPNLTENVYSFAKQLARLANLAKLYLTFNKFQMAEVTSMEKVMVPTAEPILKIVVPLVTMSM